MTQYNNEINDFFHDIIPIISKSLNKYAWVSFTNGFYKSKNDSYFVGYKISGASFPIVATLRMDFPWKLHSNYNIIRSNDYNFNKDKNGKTVLDKIFNFYFYIDESNVHKYEYKGLSAEFDEFENVPIEKYILDLKDKSKVERFNKVEQKQIAKWAENAGKNLLLNIQSGIGAQIERRFDEIVKVDEQMAMKYAPQSMKDIFLF